MTVIHTFKRKRLEKQVRFERKVLKHLTLNGIKQRASVVFLPLFQLNDSYLSIIEDICIDIAIESFLLGAKYSRLGYYGVTLDEVKQRAGHEEKAYTDLLYDYLSYWQMSLTDRLYERCYRFVALFFDEGFEIGKKRYQLRMQ